MRRYFFLVLVSTSLLLGCDRTDPTPTINRTQIDLQPDKARYEPGEPVTIIANRPAPDGAQLRFKHLHQIVDEQPASGSSYTWQPPSDDFRGYLVELYSVQEGEEILHGTTAIDVSSDWTKFPRYGFLSKFGPDAAVETVIDNLNRYHLNGLQFYDWHYKHHQPLALNGSSPAASWQDIIDRTTSFQTVADYIDAAHDRGMAAMMYNLAFGATKTAEADGVAPEWFMYLDPNANEKDRHSLPQPPFVSDIFLTDPGNPDWQSYLADRNEEVYQALDFDGFHIDQLGDRGTVYNFAGNPIDLDNRYKPFVEAMKQRHPDKQYAFNAVNQYGQGNIATSPVDFTYTEVWGPNDRYANLASILNLNRLFGQGKGSVLAAYMNYNLAENPGSFNPPAVLLTDAVIFAFGGAHIELGEHMLGREYFPNNNLSLPPALEDALVEYYDFLVAYQNVLREGGDFDHPTLQSSLDLAPWPAATGQVAVVGRDLGQRQSLQLINFVGLDNLEWRDNSGTKPQPGVLTDIDIVHSDSRTVKEIWFASPDLHDGASQSLAFTQNGSEISFTVPELRYWDLIVIEYE